MSRTSQSRSLNSSELEMIIHRRESQLSTDDVRHAYPTDFEVVKALVHEDTKAMFGDIDVLEILDKCHISVCIENINKEVVGCLCLADHPNVPSIPPWEWSHWLYNMYHLELITPRNTLFIHLIAWESRYNYSFLRPMLKYIFGRHYFVEYMILVIPPGVTKLDWLEGHGTRILPSGFSESQKVQTLYLIVRQHYVTKYKIRRAVEEDNDDLVPLIHAYSERLQEYYGEFYIAEMLTRHADSGRQLIVAEYKEQAVAVLCLNETVNLDLLNEAFELGPFYGLRKPHDEDKFVKRDISHTSTIWEEEIEDTHHLLTPIEHKFEEPQGRCSIGSFNSEEEIEVSRTPSEDSLDEISLVDISSIHLLLDVPSREDHSSVKSKSSDEYSAVILSFNDYEMHLFSDRRGLKSVSFEDLEHNAQTKSQKYIPNIPKLHGEVNAFTLELAAAHPHHEVESLTLLLEAAFECFPYRDYCVLSIPSTCPPFPLLCNFSRVAPRPVSTYPQELYVLHRNVVLSNMTVRVAIRSDISAVEYLTYYMISPGKLIASFTSAVNEDDNYRAFVLLSEDQVVGAAVIREEEDFEYLKTHYELIYWLDENHHKSGSHGLLEHLALSPIFQRHSRFFLREVHRLSDYSALYYCIFPSDTINIQKDRSLCCVLSDLIPIRPRRMFEFTHTNVEGCAPADVVHRKDAPFALYLSTGRHCTLPRYEINKKIVVVGASDTSLSFLDSLLCSWSTSYYVTFTNVSVISPHGLPYQKEDNYIRDMMFIKRSNYNYRHMHLTSLRTYVNIVNAVMTGIDRKNKLAILNDNKFLSYDLLFLMCGEQFQKPTLAIEKKEKKENESKKPKEFPENVFLINTEIDATNALLKLKTLVMEIRQTVYTVIVYGNALEAYACLASLLEYGVPGSNIVFVESFPVSSENTFTHHVSHFNDGEIDEAVQAAIHSEGITVHSSYYFAEWALDKLTNRVSAVKFESRHNKIFVECIAMFMYNDKLVSARTFLAISQAGLVFDGALVIGPDCRTNDPNIYAAGTITKYSRRYYADHMAHRYYNVEEIGYKLGLKIRQKLIPFCDEMVDPGPLICEPGNMLVPRYVKPLITYCRLPGNLRYLLVTKPGKQVPMEVAMSSDDYGQVLVTGDCKQIDKQGYFRIHLNQHGVVETITCLAKFDIDRINLTSLWGKHEKLLNNLQMRFEMVLITDLYDYFKEPWNCAIYHDRFTLLEKEIKTLLTAYTPVVGESLIEDLIRMFKENDWNKLTLDQREEIEEKFMGSPYHKLLEEKVLNFLRDNENFLPMYAHPATVRYLLQGCENSPLFEPQ